MMTQTCTTRDFVQATRGAEFTGCIPGAAESSGTFTTYPVRREKGHMMEIHHLKTWVPYFGAVIDGSKPFEVRRDDRGFQQGDRVRLIEVSEPDNGMIPTGREAEYEITYVLSGGQFGVEPGYVVLGLGSGDATRFGTRRDT